MKPLCVCLFGAFDFNDKLTISGKTLTVNLVIKTYILMFHKRPHMTFDLVFHCMIQRASFQSFMSSLILSLRIKQVMSDLTFESHVPLNNVLDSTNSQDHLPLQLLHALYATNKLRDAVRNKATESDDTMKLWINELKDTKQTSGTAESGGSITL